MIRQLYDRCASRGRISAQQILRGQIWQVNPREKRVLLQFEAKLDGVEERRTCFCCINHTLGSLPFQTATLPKS
jgi:hypothetical protein